MRTACTLAEDHDGEVLVMSAVTVPEQTPLSEGRELADRRRSVLDRAIAFATERGVPVSGTIRIGHHAADAILNTLAQHDADGVLLGWRGQRAQGRDVVLGTTVDRVVRDADCDVYVEKVGAATRRVDSILLPTAGGPHAELAAATAGVIARAEGATVRIMNVIEPGAEAADRRQAEALVASVAAEFKETDIPVETAVVEAEDVVGAITAKTGEHDLTIIGATREGLLQRLLFGAIPETVGQRAPNTVIMTKRRLRITSELRRWLHWR